MSNDHMKKMIKLAKASLGRAVQGIIEVGKGIKEAKDDLPSGEFMTLIKFDLGMDMRKAKKLMRIARHPVLSNSAHGPNLPPEWKTLAILARLPGERLLAGIRDGTINSGLEQKEAAALVKASRGERRAAEGRPRIRD